MTYVLDMNLKTIGGKECHIYKFGKFTEAVIILGTYSREIGTRNTVRGILI